MRAVETVHAEPHTSTKFPVYRVNFWQQPPPGGAWPLDAHVLMDVQSITEVLAWVENHARGRQIEVFVEIDEEPERNFEVPRKSGLVRLLGKNPNEEEGATFEIGKFIRK